MKKTVWKVLYIGFCWMATTSIVLSENEWSGWTQSGGEYIDGDSGYDVILGMIEACNIKRASCRLGAFHGEELKYHPAQNKWFHCITYDNYVDNWTGFETEMQESACRSCTELELLLLDDCKIIKKCPDSFIVNASTNKCEAYCNAGETWDAINNRCIPQQEEQRCDTKSSNPIDFIQGRKYRREEVIRSGINFPFSLSFFYNNHRNQEITTIGSKVPAGQSDAYLAASVPPITVSEYKALYSDAGRPLNDTFHRVNQYYGGLSQYWRHSFDEILQFQGSQFVYQPANGYEIVFPSFGSSPVYPYLKLKKITEAEGVDSVYKIINYKTGEEKEFGVDGRLLTIKRSPMDSLTLSYDNMNRLIRITNSEGAYVELNYESFEINSVYSTGLTKHDYLVSAKNSRGESVSIDWGGNYNGQTANFRLITQITYPSLGISQSARVFEYRDTRWPASLTDQYFVANVNDLATKKATLHYSYDELGRANFSGLYGGATDSVEYINDFTRVVTNVFGKQSTYRFEVFSGVKRLKSVTGEPSQNCVGGEVAYEYNSNGMIQSKLENQSLTAFAYDSLGRIIYRTEAAGTPQEKVIETEYHPTWNRPSKITEPGLITEMEYDSNGRLINTKKTSTISQ